MNYSKPLFQNHVYQELETTIINSGGSIKGAVSLSVRKQQNAVHKSSFIPTED